MEGVLKMETVYRANDELIFEGGDECDEYERKRPALEIYGLYGKTENLNDAYLVAINNKSGAESFISMCEEESNPYKGITKDSTGVFVWTWNPDSDSPCYIRLADEVILALNKYLTDIN